MIIRNAYVFQEEKKFLKQDFFTKDGIISLPHNAEKDEEILDAEGLYLIPGLVDIHSHGAVGCDFSDGDLEGLHKILSYQYSHGILTYCPTSMTIEKEKILSLFQASALIDTRENEADIAGFNMEGPFLDTSKKGAHREECILKPDVDFFRECNKACGNQIRLVTLAPNMEGALSFVEDLKDEVVISLGHSNADYETSKKAFDSGADHITHLYNAMAPLSHRAPGLIGAGTASEGCFAELICDGIHVHSAAVLAAFRLFPDHVCLISDSMRATGLKDGSYDLGGQTVHVNGNLATLADGTIAGSVTNLFDCMKCAISFGIPLWDAVAAASLNPAKSIHADEKIGSLKVGKEAKALLVDENLNLIRIIHH